jgi:hypothetical protein
MDTMQAALVVIGQQQNTDFLAPCCTFNCEGDLDSDGTSDATMRTASQLIHDAAAQPDLSVITTAIVQ